mgnify:FL=1
MSENLCNQQIHKNNSIGYKGVRWDKKSKKFYAEISKSKIKYWLGFFHSKEEAAFAYNKAAKELHGEFARYNFS